MRYFLSCLVGLVGGALLGSLVGLGIEQAVGQSGWSLTIGALGANGGAFWAATRRADGRPLWRVRGKA